MPRRAFHVSISLLLVVRSLYRLVEALCLGAPALMDLTLWKKKVHKRCQREEREIKRGREVVEPEEGRSADEFSDRGSRQRQQRVEEGRGW